MNMSRKPDLKKVMVIGAGREHLQEIEGEQTGWGWW
jgi:hypothetical protein